jgi:hypothetical protein
MATDPKAPEVPMEVLPPPSSEYVAQAEAKSLEFMNPKRWTVMQHMANTFINSGAIPESIKNASQMIMVFQAGYEAGMQPLEALNAFYIVNGKITMYGDAVTAQIIKAGHSVEFRGDHKAAEVTITRGDTKQSMTGTFNIEQAKELGLTTYNNGNSNPFWKKYPDRMLKYKALGTIVRFIVPDALRGVSIKEEIEASGEENIVVDQPSTEQSTSEPETPAAKAPVATKAPKRPSRASLAQALEQAKQPKEEPEKDEVADNAE